MEEFICTHSPVLYNVTLRGASKSGTFTNLGSVDNINLCIALCCELRECDLAFMMGQTCAAVKCHNEELCQTIKAKPSKLAPQLAYIRRKEVQRKSRRKSEQAKVTKVYVTHFKSYDHTLGKF